MTNPQSYNIGVFDSGVGGLTVLRQLRHQLPQESMIYFGDTARLPYGDRTQEEIIQFVRDILIWMETTQQVKMVIMACNTSSALALDIVRSEFNFPILGLILPGARAAVKKGKRIGVISTQATALSNAYGLAIAEINPKVKVWQVGCPKFVPLIEKNCIDSDYTKEVAREYLQPLIDQKIDTLIYGCTHYPHLEPILKTILPKSVNCIDPAKSVVISAEQELEALGLKNNSRITSPTRFYVSGLPQEFQKASQYWLGFTPLVEKVDFSSLAVMES